jgi:hypothetical protein
MGSHDAPQDLTTLPIDAVPATKYRRACDLDVYVAAQDRWMDYSLPEPVARPYTKFYRLAWREMIADNGERSLVACLIPPGPAHIHAVRSMALGNNLQTALVSGYWMSAVLDYLLRVTGRAHLDVSDARAMLSPERAHPPPATIMLAGPERACKLRCVNSFELFP